MKSRKSLLTGAVAGVLGTFAVLGVAGLTVVGTGAYDVAATEKHTAIGRWALDTTMENSVKRQAAGIATPVLTARMAAAGAGEYKAMCQQCHGGPGVSRAAWTEGMLPHPPGLTRAAKQWHPNEVFWMLKHGIKMSGMPAFGETHDDRTLWNIAAFVKELPTMPTERYATLGGEGHGHGGKAAGADAGAGHGQPGHAH